MNIKRTIGAVAAFAAIVIGASACQGQQVSANQRDQQKSAAILQQVENAQPAPEFKWSQIRQTAIDVETAQAHTTQTTTFFFNQGVANPVQTCPSVGFPVASTTQLTNPQQMHTTYQNPYTLPQIDPNGIYSGDSTGTYVLCVNSKGDTYGVYWEGFVYTVTGPAVWNRQTGDVEMTGPSSFNFVTKP